MADNFSRKMQLFMSAVCFFLYVCLRANLSTAGFVPDFSSITTEPFDLVEPVGIVNPVLTANDATDVDAEFVADPFLLFDNDQWYMFFEVLNKTTDQGDIALAISDDGLHWKYEKVILDETFHLSYPYVFKWENDFFMIPETKRANSIRLYKAIEFPYVWAFESTLIDGVGGLDSSIFRYNNKWWMFTSPEFSRKLDLYFADDLKGPWTRHPYSPIVEDDESISRSGGRTIVFDNGRIIRIAQKGDVVYGEEVRAFEVDVISETLYSEHEIAESPILEPGGDGWRATGMHQFDPWWTGRYWLCSVDGHNNQTYSIGIYVNGKDTDNDGILDYLDECVNDPEKNQPGICGCGIADRDSDRDGIADCEDECVNDPLKNQPGVCGCGIADADKDSDGICDCVDTDSDNDGVPDEEERGPGGDDPNYDGNGDGVADSMQSNVASVHAIGISSYITIASPAGTFITNFRFTSNPSPTDSPSAINFKFGFIEFTINGAMDNDSTTATLYLPVDETADTYFKYGPTPDNSLDHWYEFLYDGQTGATITGNVITLHLIDGARGDDDLWLNGIVVDIGGPGTSIADNSATESSSGGGGGCFIGSALAR